MEIPIQHDVYIWANYSVSSYLNFIPICWNVLCDRYNIFYHIFGCNMFVFACPIIAKSQCWLIALRTNTGQISIFALKYPYLPSYIRICWANYSVSSYLNFIPICWNVLIWLKYDVMHIFMHHLSLYFETTAQMPEVNLGGKYGYMRANTDIWGQIWIFVPL
jgi:hypothetical protein